MCVCVCFSRWFRVLGLSGFSLDGTEGLGFSRFRKPETLNPAVSAVKPIFRGPQNSEDPRRTRGFPGSFKVAPC